MWIRGLVAGTIVAVLGFGRQACAQAMPGMNMGADDAAATRVVTPPEQLPVPVRMTGIGNGHIAIKGSAEAQVWFDQGLNLLHDFWDYESAKAFEQAVRVDPQCAMCWWGLAQAEGFRGGAQKVFGERALAQAVALKDHASGTDKLYIEAAVEDRKASASNDEVGAAATAIYRKLVKKAPGDLEARLFLANSLGDGYDDKGQPKPGSGRSWLCSSSC